MREPWDEFDADRASVHEEGYAGAHYDEQGNLIGVVAGTEMAAAFQEAGFYDAGYGQGEEPFGWDHPDFPDDGPDDGPGGAGVREPRRPLPGAPFTAAEIDPDHA
jgi:hypothetical protein